MTEEIIKECEFYLPFSEDCNEILDDNGNEIYKCSKRQDCYYKQLKQAENTVNECHKYLAELEDKIERLEQERDELKFENDRYKQLLKGCPTEDEDCGLCVIDEQNKRLREENKELEKQIESQKGLITVGGKQQYEYLQRIDELEQENRWQRDEEKYLKECCIKAGKELEKHSFKWDGKEKNLVVQALQLNQLYEKLKQENKELEEKLNAFVEYSKTESDKVYYKMLDYKTVLEEIREMLGYGYIVNKINEVLNVKH